MNKRVRYYKSFEDDFFQIGQANALPTDYIYIKRDVLSRLLSVFIYFFAIIFSNIYCRLFLHIKICGAKNLRKYKEGFFLYGNHTQPIGDVFNPALVCFPKRIYTVANSVNLNLPVIGKLLPYLGALPLPSTIKGMKAFSDAVTKRVNDGHPVIIYPEAHLWEYYTKIRPFSESAFKFPVKCDKDVFCMTSTYQKRKLGKKPKATIYIDGPFKASGNSVSEKASSLQKSVYESMCNRSTNSTYEYIKYISEADE